MRQRDVSDILQYESRAERLKLYEPGGSFSLAYWQNGRDRVRYPGAEHHTFSVYKSGYSNAVRTDMNKRGQENSFCLLPAGAKSEWSLNGPISFFHIYFDDRSLKSFSEKVFDRGGESWTVPDITYQEDRELMLICQWLLNTPLDSITESSLLTEQCIITVMTYLAGKLFLSRGFPRATGGLSPGNVRMLTEYIRENSQLPLRLAELAALTGLSEFHFQRMFRKSFSIPPHEYVSRVRIEKARQMIHRGAPLSQIAQDTGFSSQPHFTRVFKRITGLTPGQYKAEK